ncbi:hypothetical protein E2C01_076152 [Portunus trituberculatus]|uniref:Uncharacterized protein n=1 Tax=Portunus trituberculatus TaxID=210409 RepID=A0A5B7I7Z1_PORTR|nr:hypothetical protein [Portunus trituberculatus]
MASGGKGQSLGPPCFAAVSLGTVRQDKTQGHSGRGYHFKRRRRRRSRFIAAIVALERRCGAECE